jgi:hypothetical protein
MDKFAGNFRLLDVCDVSEIKEKLAALSDADWEAANWRQKRFDAHRDTQNIELIFCKDFRFESPAQLEMYSQLGCEDLLAPLCEVISDYYTGDGYVVRALLVRLRAGGVILEHVDSGYLLMNSRRIHIPIVSNEEVVFTVGDEACVMKEGELWEINNARTHKVENPGDSGRVHLIIDWVAT